jgi:hypothetical protein
MLTVPTIRLIEVIFRRIGKAEMVADNLYPETRYAKRDVTRLLPNGEGPYCKFVVPELPSAPGVYAVFIGGSLKYVGKAEDLKRRFHHYGNISPRNCYLGGRATNIRLNKLIRTAIRSGVDVEIFIHSTAECSTLEEQMILELQPPWNIRGIKSAKSLVVPAT